MYKIISKKEYNYWQEKIETLQKELQIKENYINILERTNQDFLNKIIKQKEELRNNKFKWN